MSILLGTAAIQAEIDRYRNKLYEEDLITAMKDLGADALAVIREIIQNPNEKSSLRADQSRWLLEKLTGKAKQEVNVESNTLAAFMETLRRMERSGETLESPAIDVTPAGESGEQSGASRPALAAPAENKFEKWVDSEL